jgi:hypothetical protein
MVEKNRILMGRNGRKIDIRMTATSEEQAIKLYKAIESALIQAVRIDLESEWERDGEGDNG